MKAFANIENKCLYTVISTYARSAARVFFSYQQVWIITGAGSTYKGPFHGIMRVVGDMLLSQNERKDLGDRGGERCDTVAILSSVLQHDIPRKTLMALL